MSIERLLIDYGVPHVTEGHKHCREGWVNVPCPFCTGNPGYHLGIHVDGNGTNCWRCGSHPMTKVLSTILNMPVPKVRQLLRKYRTGSAGIQRTTTEPKVAFHPFKFPKPCFTLNEQGKKYLSKRRFDPDYLEQEWGLLQTGPVSFLDGISYKHRILIPINWGGQIVSFQARDITDKSEMKYLACLMRREKINHKHVLYGKQEYWRKTNSIIVVEGVTDVWRLGPSAVATFGIEFKMEQVLQLKKAADRFFILFDSETQAQKQARLLAVKLRALGKEVYIETVEGDPGGMKQEDAKCLVKELIKR